MIRSNDGDNVVARAASDEKAGGGKAGHIASFADLLRKQSLSAFTASVVLLHFANGKQARVVRDALATVPELERPFRHQAFQKHKSNFEMAFQEYKRHFRPFIEEVPADAEGFCAALLAPKAE